MKEQRRTEMNNAGYHFNTVALNDFLIKELVQAQKISSKEIREAKIATILSINDEFEKLIKKSIEDMPNTDKDFNQNINQIENEEMKSLDELPL
ncbi:TPA: hypothetical protein ACGO5G_000458 [Streptococcus suis]